jgi:pyruvate/2-oxoglutarate dehydrogenase complex dihydrolipoamide dehydrogenase (E3) component
MAWEYDLVVIGGTCAGLQAAIAARVRHPQHPARVAIVISEPLAAESYWTTQTLSQFSHQLAHPPLGVEPLSPAAPLEAQAQVEAAEWVMATVGQLQAKYCPAYLAELGIDVVLGRGQFQAQPSLHFEVEGRGLRSRAYLIASSRPASDPQILGPSLGLNSADYLTPETWAGELLQAMASGQLRRQTWLVAGDQPSGIELAQVLARLGNRVTLVVPGQSLLPQEDGETVAWLQAQLEADGVAIITGSQITAVQSQGKGYEIEIQDPWGKMSLPVDRLLLCQTGAEQDDLNLNSLALRCGPQGIWVNDFLQTSHPQLYVCGDRLGGYGLFPIALQEANLAVYNALHLWKRRINYYSLVWGLATDPPWARVGWNQRQARQHYPGQILILNQKYHPLECSQFLGHSGFCQLVVHRNGRILGATIFGSGATELMPLIALALQQRLKISALETLAAGDPSLMAIVCQSASQGH